ncbi:hypothetical protein HHUSO_G15839 [Huso huso]|uniref:Uncharacterized protein n=1 Tax=Huso huso TaxID=61971 RepID=A0ABR0ZD79_HUSHU
MHKNNGHVPQAGSSRESEGGQDASVNQPTQPREPTEEQKMTLWQGRAQQQMQLSLRSERGTEWMLLQSPVQREQQLRKEKERETICRHLK